MLNKRKNKMRNPHKKPTAEQRKIWDAKHYQSHKAEIQAQHKLYNSLHKEEVTAQRKVYYENNKEELNAKRRIRDAKRNYKTKLEALTQKLQSNTLQASAETKRDLVSLMSSEILLSESRGGLPEFGLRRVLSDLAKTPWQEIANVEPLRTELVNYLSTADETAYDDVTYEPQN